MRTRNPRGAVLPIVRGRLPDPLRSRPRLARLGLTTLGLWAVVAILAAVVLVRAL